MPRAIRRHCGHTRHSAVCFGARAAAVGRGHRRHGGSGARAFPPRWAVPATRRN